MLSVLLNFFKSFGACPFLLKPAALLKLLALANLLSIFACAFGPVITIVSLFNGVEQVCFFQKWRHQLGIIVCHLLCCFSWRKFFSNNFANSHLYKLCSAFLKFSVSLSLASKSFLFSSTNFLFSSTNFLLETFLVVIQQYLCNHTDYTFRCLFHLNLLYKFFKFHSIFQRSISFCLKPLGSK